MWKFFLANARGKDVAVNTDKGEDRGLVVATRDHKTYTSKTAFFTNPTYGREMAQNGAYNAIKWNIHDGTDTTEADSGNCDGIGVDTNKLKDGGQNFTDTVVAGMTVHNTTDGTYTWVSAVESDTVLSVLDDIMDDGDDYIIAPDWTFSEPAGIKWVEDDTAQAHDGTKSLLCDNANINDIMQLLNVNGEGITLSHCVAVTMWIRVSTDWEAGDSVSFYGHNGGTLIGNKVSLENYFDFSTHDTWHYINIPLADMGLTVETLDAFRFENEARAGGKSPKFWIDEIEFKVSGTPIAYSITPDKGTWFHVTSYQTTFVDVLDGKVAEGTMPGLAYNQILGMEPTMGYKYERYSEENPTPIFAARIANLMDLLSFPHSKLSATISDGTNTLITISQDQPEHLVLKAEDLDKMVMTIEDDFSQLLYFRVCANGYVEQRE